MPPSTKTNSQRKRTLAEADPNIKTSAPKAKKGATGQRVESATKPNSSKPKDDSSKSKKPSTTGTKKSAPRSKAKSRSNASEETNTENSGDEAMSTEEQSTAATIQRAKSLSEVPARVRYGPNGELFVPHVLPLEAMKPGMKAKIYPPSCVGIDGVPGRPMTTGNEMWWGEYKEWLEKHAKALKFDEQAWRKQAADSKAKAKLSAKEKKAEEDADRRMLEEEKRKGREDFDWVCTCRPACDVRDDNPDGDGSHPCGENCVINQLTRYYPDHKWILTLRGADRLSWWNLEMFKRSQDDFDMHIYNDFSGYGIIEVMQNQILAFDKAFKKHKENGLAIWAELEGMAFFLNQDLHPLMMCDDSDGIRAHVAVVGHAVLNTVALIIEKGEFKPDSRIKNLGIILALFIRFVCKALDDWDPSDKEALWAGNLVALADEHKVELNVLSSFEDTLEELRDANESRADDTEFGEPLDTGKPWDGVLKKYTKDQARSDGKSKPKIGGTYHDITLMKAAEKKRYDIGGGGGLGMFF